MKIEIKIDEGCTETKIIVVTSKVTEEVNEIIKRLSSEQPQMIAGFKDEQATMLEPTQIYRVYASEGKVYAEVENGTHLLRLRLYEAEQRLAKCSFVRISNSEIINLKKVKGFDLRRWTKGYTIKQPNMDCQPTEITALMRHRAVFS